MNSVMYKTRLAEKRLQKKKQYEINKRRALIREQNKRNKKIKQNERKQKRENIINEDFDLDKFFELASTNKIYETGLKLHETKNEIL